MKSNELRILGHGNMIDIAEAIGDRRWRFIYMLPTVIYNSDLRLRYHPIRQLGRGSQGSVWECRDPSFTGRTVAVKVSTRSLNRPTGIMNAAREISMLKRLWEASPIAEYRRICTLPRGFLSSLATTPIPIVPFRGSWSVWGHDCASSPDNPLNIDSLRSHIASHSSLFSVQ